MQTADSWRYIPACILSNSTIPIKSPHDKNSGISSIDKNSEVLTEFSTLRAISSYLLETFSVEILGISTILNEPTTESGAKSSGKVIPINMPYSLIAWLGEYPHRTRSKGISVAVKGWIRLDAMRTPVIEDELLINFLYSPFLNFNLPPSIKYITATKIAEMRQVIENAFAVTRVAVSISWTE